MPSSRQINASGLPSYMRRRASLPGPVIGPLSSLSLGPVSAVATARYNFYQQIVGRPGFTPIAVSWYARAAADTATMVFGDAAASTGGISVWHDVVSIDLVATPSGLALLDVSTPSLTRALVGDPAPTSSFYAARINITGGSATDVSVVIWGFYTDFTNLLPVSD